jgi:hypothetical protein
VPCDPHDAEIELLRERQLVDASTDAVSLTAAATRRMDASSARAATHSTSYSRLEGTRASRGSDMPAETSQRSKLTTTGPWRGSVVAARGQLLL